MSNYPITRAFCIICILCITMLSGITAQKTSKSITTITTVFCTKMFQNPSPQYDYCMCQISTADWQDKEICELSATKNFHLDIQSNYAKVSQDEQNNQIVQTRIIDMIQSYKSMCNLIFGKGSGRAAMCACDAYDLYGLGPEHHTTCVRNAEPLLRHDIAVEEHHANAKPLCEFVGTIGHAMLNLAMPATVAMSNLLAATSLHATWETISNPWTYVTASAGVAYYIHQCVLN
jgi:hypothetical protein